MLNEDTDGHLHRAIVSIKCSYHDCEVDKNNNSMINAINDACKHQICQISIDSKIPWKLMDGIITYVLKRYFKLIDPNGVLGLDRNSIEYYIIGEITRHLNDKNVPSMLPFGYLVGNYCSIQIVLKGNY